MYDIRREIYNFLCIKDVVRLNTSVCKNELKYEFDCLIQNTRLLNITLQIKLLNYPDQHNKNTRYLILNNKQITIKTCKLIKNNKQTKIEILEGKLLITILLNNILTNSCVKILFKVLFETNFKTSEQEF